MKNVRLTIEGSSAVLTLDRAEEGNRLSGPMFADLAEAVADIEGKAGLRALLIEASGPDFCVGGAIDEFAGDDEPLDLRLARTLPKAHRLIESLTTLPFPVIAAVKGAVAGGGIGLALAADIVLASDDVVFRAGYPGIGLSPDLGGSFQLARRAGPGFATEFLMTNRRVGGEEALRRGLVNALHPGAGLPAAARDLLEKMAGGATHALACAKRLVAAQPTLGLTEHLALETELMVRCAASRDAAEGVSAFIAKKRPDFSGN